MPDCLTEEDIANIKDALEDFRINIENSIATEEENPVGSFEHIRILSDLRDSVDATEKNLDKVACIVRVRK